MGRPARDIRGKADESEFIWDLAPIGPTRTRSYARVSGSGEQNVTSG